MISEEQAAELLNNAPPAAAVRAYPAPGDRILFVATDDTGGQVATFTVPRGDAERLVSGTLGAALILSRAAAEVE